ncbi:MAG: hypothetical protein HUU29_10585 [Planctomycetaceae bacterium]|nr:hypothetical protein [Planctomycetaceae bacterium]
MLEPKLVTLLLCDSVGQASGGRKTLYGLIDHLRMGAFPALLPHCAVFGRFGSGHGSFEARFTIRGPNDRKVFETKSACKFSLDDPLQTADVVLSIDNLQIPEPGTYWIEAWIGGKRLALMTPIYVDPT